jgi:uncharacterized protein (TIGR02246 family)
MALANRILLFGLVALARPAFAGNSNLPIGGAQRPPSYASTTGPVGTAGTASVSRSATAVDASKDKSTADAVSPSAPAAETASDEQSIRTAVVAFQEAWNHHDMKAMADVFTEDADLINVVGTRWQGRANIVKALGVFHREMFRNEQIHFGEITIRSVTRDVAVAVTEQTGSGEMSLPEGHGRKITPTGSQLDTFMVVKRDGIWKVTHGQNTTVNPDAQKFDPIQSNWNGEIPQ